MCDVYMIMYGRQVFAINQHPDNSDKDKETFNSDNLFDKG